MRTIERRATAAALVLATLYIGSATAYADLAPVQVSYIAVPHPDDEFQAWSLIEFSPDNYKVFIVMTRGEESEYCNGTSYKTALQDKLGELPAVPEPAGKGSSQCKTARNKSMIDFLSQMAKTDSTIPGSFVDRGIKGPFPDNGYPVCNAPAGIACDKATAAQRLTALSPQVWVDSRGWGAVVSFDMGNKNLTKEEVVWAVKTVRTNRGALGLNTTLPDYVLIGTYSNLANNSCFKKVDEDHRAVHEALFYVDFGLKYQAAATCKDDSDQSRSEVVSVTSAAAAFAVIKTVPGDIRIGAHTKNYGWLHTEYYPVDPFGQSDIFHTHQYFWIRYPHDRVVPASW